MIQNVCGVIVVDSQDHMHPAWRTSKGIFGTVKRAFTLAGNFVLQGNQLFFKGATNLSQLKSVVQVMVCGEFAIRVQLAVVCVKLNACVDVRRHGTLEEWLEHVSWVRIMGRMEEICNVVVFYIVDWDKMKQDIATGMQAPVSTTVTVTRRGTVTVRMTWNKGVWPTEMESFVSDLGNFLRQYVKQGN